MYAGTFSEFLSSRGPRYVIDESTGEKYLNESFSTLRQKLALAFVGSVFLQPLLITCQVALSVLKIISCYPMWAEGDELSLQDRVVDMGKEACKVALSPLVLTMLIISPLWGMVFPNDGRKLYASTELYFYGFTPYTLCFVPSPTAHLFGGNLAVPNAW